MPNGQDLIAKFEQLLGYKYIFGGELNGTAPGNCDCSEGVEWTCRNLGISPKMPDGSGNQFNHCDYNGGRISFDQARNTPGSLLFKSYDNDEYPPGDRNSGGIYHVAMVKSWDQTMEVCCDDGQTIKHMSISGRSWYKYGGLIPGVSYDGAPPVSSWDTNAAFHRNLSRKSPMMMGEDVKWVQNKVAVNADGEFGDQTKSAVVSWQGHNNQTADGVVGPATAAAMEMPGATSSNPPPPTTGTLGPFPLPSGHWFGQVSSDSRNHSGSGHPSDHPDRNAIRKIQSRVGASQDGLYGPNTENGVRSWQSSHALAVDGDCGAKTWATM